MFTRLGGMVCTKVLYDALCIKFRNNSLQYGTKWKSTYISEVTIPGYSRKAEMLSRSTEAGVHIRVCLSISSKLILLLSTQYQKEKDKI